MLSVYTYNNNLGKLECNTIVLKMMYLEKILNK